MDTSEQTTLETIRQTNRRRRSLEEKRRIVEETLEPGASVARVARRHAVNANQVFYWRKKYREGRLGKGRSSNLLPVAVSDIPWSKSGQVRCVSSRCPLGQWKLNCRRANFVSRVGSKQNRCVSCWSVCSDDRTAHRDKHLDRRRIHGSAAWFYRAEWHGTDDTSGESVFWSRVCFPGSAG